LFQRLGFIDGEIVAVKYVEDSGAGDAVLDEPGIGEQLVWQDDVGLAPIVIAEGFKQPAVQERNPAFETVAPRLITATRRERIVKERFEHIVEEIFVAAVIAAREPAQEIMRARAPVLPFRHAEPAFLLQKIEEHDLTRMALR